MAATAIGITAPGGIDLCFDAAPAGVTGWSPSALFKAATQVLHFVVADTSSLQQQFIGYCDHGLRDFQYTGGLPYQLLVCACLGAQCSSLEATTNPACGMYQLRPVSALDWVLTLLI